MGKRPRQTLAEPARARNPERPSIRAVWMAALLTGVLVLPFAGKAVHVDDPLFIWAAQHIQVDPVDPYGFDVNWYGETARMADVMKNPPLVSYYLAAAGRLAGWNELVLHLAMLLPTALAAAGTYLLAARLTPRPELATAFAVLTPAFLISATTLMCDVPMLAVWVFAVWFWIRGLDHARHRDLAIGMILAGIATLTKYFGASLVPLLLVYAWVRKPQVAGWWWHAAAPIAILTAYHFTTQTLYGHSLLLDAAGYAATPDPGENRFVPTSVLVGLAFTGGCLASVFCVVHRLWSPRTLVAGAVAIGLIAVAAGSAETLRGFRMSSNASPWPIAAQAALWAVAGLSVLALALREWLSRRDADALLLALWVFGTFLFAVFVNWTLNGRSLLPMVVPAGMLAARRLDQLQPIAGSRKLGRTVAIPLGIAAAIALSVAWGDMASANASRDLSARVRQAAAGVPRVWFQGHWGFQYYMEAWGASPIDVRRSPIRGRELIAIPYPNTNLFPVPQEVTAFRGSIELLPGGWLTTMGPGRAAGFYGGLPLPFAVGANEPHVVQLFDVVVR